MKYCEVIYNLSFFIKAAIVMHNAHQVKEFVKFSKTKKINLNINKSRLFNTKCLKTL